MSINYITYARDQKTGKKSGDIIKSAAQLVIVPVTGDADPGAGGLFRLFPGLPQHYAAYVQKNQPLQIGEFLKVENEHGQTFWLVCMREHYGDPVDMTLIAATVVKLAGYLRTKTLHDQPITHVALPKLGCGVNEGGPRQERGQHQISQLRWMQVASLYETWLAPVSGTCVIDVHITEYDPKPTDKGFVHFVRLENGRFAIDPAFQTEQVSFFSQPQVLPPAAAPTPVATPVARVRVAAAAPAPAPVLPTTPASLVFEDVEVDWSPSTLDDEVEEDAAWVSTLEAANV